MIYYHIGYRVIHIFYRAMCIIIYIEQCVNSRGERVLGCVGIQYSRINI